MKKGVHAKNGPFVQNTGSLTDSSYNSLTSDKIIFRQMSQIKKYSKIFVNFSSEIREGLQKRVLYCLTGQFCQK